MQGSGRPLGVGRAPAWICQVSESPSLEKAESMGMEGSQAKTGGGKASETILLWFSRVGYIVLCLAVLEASELAHDSLGVAVWVPFVTCSGSMSTIKDCITVVLLWSTERA
mmetsp:Transcript_20417/g.46306  ORF Transcript_20417/g.46306 Transcript_20417/m.46306 type:complete len:111 (+) Transcript_20417:547-879(+)